MLAERSFGRQWGKALAQQYGLVPSTYDGREQAFIKHRLLECYLQKLFLIVGASVGQGGNIELCYVDCFAGPWSDESEDLGGTSIGVSLKTMDICRQTLGRRGVSARMRALFVEKESTAYARLDKFLRDKTPHGVCATAMQGDFVAVRDDLLTWCGPEAFAFFFIDPKGWKAIGVRTLEPLVRRKRSEFLINFQYDFVNRTMSMTDMDVEMIELVGEQVHLEGLSSKERERRIIDVYRGNLKRCTGLAMTPARSGYVRVLDREKDRPKYHLVYLTSHPRGIIEFMEISQHIDLIQKQVRAVTQDRARAERSRMNDLFGPETRVDPSHGRANPDDVDRFWIDYLRDGMRPVGADQFADILEQTNWFPGDLQAALVRLIAAGKVVNLDVRRARPKIPLHWKENERLQLVEV